MKLNIDPLISIVNQFPEAGKEQTEITAKQLKMLHYDFELGPYQIELMYADHQTVIDYLEKLANMSFQEFENTRFIESEYKDGSKKDEYLINEKKRRASYIISKYHLLCMLRQDNEEAWDEVNELYFDD